MKLLAKLTLGLILIAVVGLGYVYFLFNNSTPRDLGIAYTKQDHESGRAKSQIVYEEPVDKSVSSKTWQTMGKRDIDTVFSSSEITAIMNNKPGIYFPYKNVQLKFNADGSGEISGNLVKSRIPTYAKTFEAPQVAVDLVMKFLPDNPSFYLKGKATLVNNNVGVFEPIKFEIGRVAMPLGPILASNRLVKRTYAMDISGLLDEISTVKNKKQIIIDFVNSRLAMIEGFYAQDAHFEENKLIYKGTLPEKEVTVR